MPPLPKRGSGSSGQGLPVAEHCKRFLEKVLRGGYGDTEQENMRVAGANFLETMMKLAEVGNKEDIRIPLRVIRDEVGRVYNGGDPKRKVVEIDMLFGLYDLLERSCQDNVKTGRGQDAAKAEAILEGMRERFSRLVIGETWDQYPELKLMALKRIYRYSVREGSAFRSRTKFGTGSGGSNLPTLSSKKSTGMKGMFGLGVSKSMNLATTMTRDVTGGGAPPESWQAVLNDLGKCPGTRLISTMKLLLMENEGDLSIRDSGANKWGSGVGEADAGHLDDAAAGRSTSVSKPPLPTVTSKSSQENGAASPTSRSPPKGPAKVDLTPAASDASAVEMTQPAVPAAAAAGGTAPGRGMSDVDLDDLLGLDEPAQISSPTLPLSNVTSPTSAPSPAAAQTSADPFHGFMDSPKAAGQTAGPSSSMGMFGSSHPTPALPSPSQPQKQAADPFGADPFGGVGPQEATAAPRTSGGTHPQQATSPFAATPAASGFAGQDPFGMSSFGGTESGLTGLGSGFEESAFAAPLQPGAPQHQQATASNPAAATAEPSFNPFAPTSQAAPPQAAAMAGWGGPAPTAPGAAAGTPAAGGAFDFSSFGQQAFGGPPAAPKPGTNPAPTQPPAAHAASSATNPWGENAF